MSYVRLLKVVGSNNNENRLTMVNSTGLYHFVHNGAKNFIYFKFITLKGGLIWKTSFFLHDKESTKLDMNIVKKQH